MIDVDIKGNTLTFLLEGVLSKTERFPLSAQDLKGKKIILSGKNIDSWDTNFVAELYCILKNAPKENITFKSMPEGMESLLRLAFQAGNTPRSNISKKSGFLESVGGKGLSFYQSVKRGSSFIHQCLVSWGRQLTGKAVYRNKDFLMILADCGPKAVLIVSLISFMVGLILAFVGALQLKTFGAQIYVASLVTIGMTRIMGAIMTGIIMAGRTGASYAASIGTMQVNEELDALQTMGIPKTDFLVLPRINALLLSMPILILLSDIMGILGGCFVCVICWGIPLSEYIKYTINSFDMINFLVGVFHGIVFSMVIAFCGCYFGVNCGRNADSVGSATTNAVVYGIVWMIVMTGLITLACEAVGI